MNEEWRPVAGYEGYYEVSNRGRVRSLYCSPPLIRKATVTKSGWRIGLKLNGRLRNKLVHVLVAEAFLAPRPENHEVNHKDWNRFNNHLNNLEWVTKSKNCLHSWTNPNHRTRVTSAARTHCSKGHLLPPYDPQKPRRCPTCKYLIRRAWAARNPEKNRMWGRESMRRRRQRDRERKAG